MNSIDILAAGFLAYGMEALDTLEREFAAALGQACGAGIIHAECDMVSLANAAESTPEDLTWPDLHMLPPRYAVIASLQWAARDIRMARQGGAGWYVHAAHGGANVARAVSLTFAIVRERESGDAARGSRRGKMERQRVGEMKRNKIRNAALEHMGKRTREGAATLIATDVGASSEYVRQVLSKEFPKDTWKGSRSRTRKK